LDHPTSDQETFHGLFEERRHVLCIYCHTNLNNRNSVHQNKKKKGRVNASYNGRSLRAGLGKWTMVVCQFCTFSRFMVMVASTLLPLHRNSVSQILLSTLNKETKHKRWSALRFYCSCTEEGLDIENIC
jgi:hypothetical protein